MLSDGHRRTQRVVAAALFVAGSTAFGFGPAALAQAAGTAGGVGTNPAATSLSPVVERARHLMKAGRWVEARAYIDSLVRPGSSLNGADLDAVLDLRRQADTQIRTANSDEISTQKAELFVADGDLLQAERFAKAVNGKAGADKAVKARAKAVLDEVAARRQTLRPSVDSMVTGARADFQSGRYAAAKANILALLRSGIALDPAQAQELEGYQLKIVDIEQTQGRPFDISAEAGMAMLQPGEVRRPGRPAGEPAPAPAEQPSSPEPAPVEPPPEPAPAPAPAPAADEPPPPPPPPVASDDDLVRTAMRAEAQSVLAEADRAYDAARYAEAADRYTVLLNQFRAYLSDEDANRAQRRLEDARIRQSTPSTLAGDVRASMDIRRQQAEAQFENLVQQANAALERGDTGQAQARVAEARLAISSAREVFDQASFDALQGQLEALTRQIDTRRNQITAAEQAAQEAAEARRVTEAEANRVRERDRRVDESIIRVRALQQERKYREALEVTDQVLFIDPNNPTALLLRDILQDIVVYEEYNRNNEIAADLHAHLTLDNQRAAVPNRNIMDFPIDWPAKTFERGELAAYAESPENRRVLADLATRRVPVDFTDNRLEDVISFLQTVTQVNVDTDWESLESIGINRDTTVSLKLSPMPVQTVLDRVLAKAGTDQFAKAGWTVSDGVLTIASDETLRKNRSLVIYNIQDLLFEIPDYAEVPEVDLQSVLQQGQGGGGGQSPFQDNEEEEEEDLTREERIRQIVDIIQANVDFEGWRDNGGETGSLQELNGSLIITNTPRNHREIVGLLSKLREIRNMQINVETKFLLVNQSWFEQIGFDMDVVLNADNNQVRAAQGVDPSVQPGDFFDFGNGGLQRQIIGQGPVNGITPSSGINQNLTAQAVRPPSNGFSPVGIGQNSIGLTTLLGNETDFAGQVLGAAPALGIAGQFLDDVQVDFLIVATQADRRTVQLTAPRLTFTNGQTANIYVVTQQAFVSDLQPIVGDSAVGFDPDVNTVSEGVTMLVEGVISSDRRYVTMNIDAGVARIDGFGQEAVTAVAGGQLVNSADTQSFIQLPTVTVTRVRTTATVPDEGTLLLGGQRLVTEVEVETGVPVLSKIPIINRFFTNRIESKEEQTLLILVKPTVIIQTEEEDKAHPGLEDAVRTGFGSLR